MRSFVPRTVLGATCFAASVLVGHTSFGGLLLNYQFEEVFGSAPTQTTKDSALIYPDSVNEVLGPGSTPGTDYPQQVTGLDLVANGTVKSLNPNSFMHFTGPNGIPPNNNSAKVRITDANAGVLDTALTQFTFATWVKPTFVPNDSTTDRLIAGKAGGGTSGSNRGWQISSPPQQTTSITGATGSITVSGGDDLLILYHAASNSSSARNLVVQDVLPLNTWTHIAFTFNGTTGTEAIYINGVPVSFAADPTGVTSVPATLNGSNAGSFMAGARAGTANDGSRLGGIFGWVGGLDDVIIYNEALDAAQVQNLVVAVPEPCSIIFAALAFFGSLAFKRFGTT